MNEVEKASGVRSLILMNRGRCGVGSDVHLIFQVKKYHSFDTPRIHTECNSVLKRPSPCDVSRISTIHVNDIFCKQNEKSDVHCMKNLIQQFVLGIRHANQRLLLTLVFPTFRKQKPRYAIRDAVKFGNVFKIKVS